MTPSNGKHFHPNGASGLGGRPTEGVEDREPGSLLRDNKSLRQMVTTFSSVL